VAGKQVFAAHTTENFCFILPGQMRNCFREEAKSQRSKWVCAEQKRLNTDLAENETKDRIVLLLLAAFFRNRGHPGAHPINDHFGWRG